MIWIKRNSVQFVIKHLLQSVAVYMVVRAHCGRECSSTGSQKGEEGGFVFFPSLPLSSPAVSSAGFYYKRPNFKSRLSDLEGSRGLPQLLASLRRNTRHLYQAIILYSFPLGHLAAGCSSCLWPTLGITPVLAREDSQQANTLRQCFCFRH